jgi:LysR family glycine cleavage system transcriptional activator
MSEWLPSLSALRAFEAVCRHLNYAKAAEELGVTPAAVKQLVHKLQETLGTQLVERSGRGLAVTPAGRAGFEGLSGGFTQINRAVGRMRACSGRLRLIVSAEPSFATAWLVRRLERFRRINVDVDVLIDSSAKIIDLEKGEADIAIRFGAQPDERLLFHRLFDEQLSAFCGPSLADGRQGLRQLNDLERATLLHWDTSGFASVSPTRKWMGWQPWLEMIGAKHINWQRGIRFNDYNLAVQAAIAGQGVVLGSLPILRDLVDAKLLVSPFEEKVETDIGYDIVMTRRAQERREVRDFADWIIAEVGADKLARSEIER